MSLSKHQEAEQRLTEAASIARDQGSHRLEGWAIAYLMTNHVWMLRVDDAYRDAALAMEAFNTAGDMFGVGYVTFMETGLEYGMLAASGEMDPDKAEEFIAKLSPIAAAAETFGERNLIGHVSDILGPMALDAGHDSMAAQHLDKTIESFDALGNQICLAHGLDHVALLAARTGNAEGAVTILGASTALRRSLGVVVRKAEQISFDVARDRASEALTPDAFERSWDAGEIMSRSEAVAFAHHQLRRISG